MRRLVVLCLVLTISTMAAAWSETLPASVVFSNEAACEAAKNDESCPLEAALLSELSFESGTLSCVFEGGPPIRIGEAVAVKCSDVADGLQAPDHLQIEALADESGRYRVIDQNGAVLAEVGSCW